MLLKLGTFKRVSLLRCKVFHVFIGNIAEAESTNWKRHRSLIGYVFDRALLLHYIMSRKSGEMSQEKKFNKLGNIVLCKIFKMK